MGNFCVYMVNIDKFLQLIIFFCFFIAFTVN